MASEWEIQWESAALDLAIQQELQVVDKMLVVKIQAAIMETALASSAEVVVTTNNNRLEIAQEETILPSAAKEQDLVESIKNW